MTSQKNNIESIAPLTPLQQGILFHALAEPEAGVYIDQLTWTLRVDDRFETGLFFAALQSVVDRHEALRTVFVWERRDEPLQIALRRVTVPGVEHDWRDVPEPERTVRFERLLAEDRRRGFDLSRPPLLRVTAIRTGDREYRFVWTHHHILLDAWSVAILIRELFAECGARSTGGGLTPSVRRPFREYVAWARGHDAGEEFWRGRLADVVGPTPLPAGFPDGGTGVVTASAILDRAAAATLAELARSNRLTLNAVVLGAYGLLLQRHAGTSDVVLGVTVSGRSAPVPGIEGMVGLFINTVPVRLRPEGRVVEYLRRVATELFEVQRFEASPVNRVREWSGCPRHTDLYRTIFTFENVPLGEGARLGETGWTIEGGNYLTRTNFPLSVLAVPGDEVTLRLTGDARVFDAATLDRLMAGFLWLLSEFAANPAGRVTEIAASHPDERRRIAEFGRGESVAGTDASVTRRIWENAARRPDAIAVRCGKVELTYRGLVGAALKVAADITAVTGVPSGGRTVAVLVERSPEFVVAVLGVMFAGAAFVPIDPDQPAARTDAMIREADCIAVVCRTERAVAGFPIVLVDGTSGPTDGQPAPVEPESPAYVIFTSGSTGRPKGVVVPHGALGNYLDWVNRTLVDRGLVIPFLGSPTFDASLKQYLAPLLRGETVAVLPDATPEAVLELAATYDRVGINCVPAFWEAILDSLDGRATTSISDVFLGGEALTPSLADRTFAALPGARMWNLYGPTEAAANATAARIFPGSPIRLGRPVANCRVHVLDANLAPTPIGAAGELFIGGAGLALGYLGRPDLTAERFLPDPFGATTGARLYRTGDRARFLPDGSLEFLGRTDQQIKLRGFRIEPAEIEAALRRHPGVREAVVVPDREDRPTALVAYVTGDAPVENVRDRVKSILPDHLVPKHIVALDSFPRTATGKIDRRKLPAHHSPASLPESEPVGTERTVGAVWKELLGIDGIGRETNFFDAGGHSILAMQAVARLKKAFDTEIPLRLLFENPTVGTFAGAIDRLGGRTPEASAPGIVPAVRHPLSFAQHRLWVAEQAAPQSPFIITTALRLTGRLDAGAVGAALDRLVERHAILRTSFALDAEGPVQIVHPPFAVRPKIERVDGEDAVRRVLAEETAARFDLETAPLFRVRLLALGETDHVAVFSLHHLIGDAWSSSLLVRDFAWFYADVRGAADGLPPLPALATDYATFARRQREEFAGDRATRLEHYPQGGPAGIPTVFDLPTDFPRPAKRTLSTGGYPFHLEGDKAREFTAFCRKEGVTPFMGFLAVFQAVLARWTGRTAFLIGSPTAGRTNPDLEPLVGCFINLLVLPARVGDDPSGRRLLARARDATLDAFAHQDLPFERLVELARPPRDESRAPLVQVTLTLQNTPRTSLTMADLSVERIEHEGGGVEFDLSLILAETADGVRGRWIFNTGLFRRETVAALDRMFRAIVAGLVAAPDARLSTIGGPDEEETGRLLALAAPPARHPRVAVHRRFEEYAARFADRIALAGAGGEISYTELNRRANRLAAYLRSLGVKPGTVVGLGLPRSVEATVAMLAILKAGAAYLPLDPSHPVERSAFLLADARCALTIVSEAVEDRFPAFHGFTLVIEEHADAVAAMPGDNPPGPSDPEAPAYVMYTSGSTGKPKGVVVPHRAVVRLVAECGYVPLTDRTVLLHHSPAGFDASTLEVWGALLNGGTCVLFEGDRPTPDDFRRCVAEYGVNVLWLTSALFNLVIDTDPQALRGIGHLLAGGEALSPGHLRRAFEELPETVLVNGYGPTENTTFSCHRTIAPDDVAGLSVPIGAPIPGTSAFVLDDRFNLVPLGLPGELFVGGDGLALGYLNRPDLTAERFVPDPFSPTPGGRLYRTGDLVHRRADGAIEFLGRRDRQIKLRGFRIEPGEIEAALTACPGVARAFVTIREDLAGHRQLVGYVVPTAGADTDRLRTLLAARLPEHLVPAAIVAVSEFPLSPNGKIDASALPPPEPPVESPVLPPETDAEVRLAGLWRDILGHSRVGRDSNFFDLGGDSIRAIQLAARARTAGIGLSLDAIFRRPVLADQAAEVSPAATESPRTAPFELVTDRDRAALPPGAVDAYPLSRLQAGMLFHTELNPGSAVYHDIFSYHVRAPFDAEVLRGLWARATALHPVLRTSFALTGFSEPLQIVWADAPTRPAVHDARGLSEEEQEAVVADHLRREASTPFDLETAPLFRMAVHRRTEESFQLTLSFHHVILDGWSLVSLLADLLRGYAGRGTVSPPPDGVAFRDFIALERAALAAEEQRNFWRRLIEAPPRSPLPALAAPTPATPAPVSFVVAPDRVTRLKGVAAAAGLPLKSLLLAVHLRVLAWLAGDTDVLTGLVAHGRPETEGAERVLGLFLNTLPFRLRLPEGTWLDLARAAFDRERDVMPNRRFPFAEIQRMHGKAELLDSSFNFLHYHVLADLPRAEVGVLKGASLTRSNFTLAANLTLEPNGSSLSVALSNHNGKLDRATLDRLAAAYAGCLEAVAESPASPWRAFLPWTPRERGRALVEWNATHADYRPACVHEIFGEWAARRPEAPAILCGAETWTYAELNARANRFAAALARRGAGPGARVAIRLDRSPDIVAAVLGVLKTGAAFVPLDPAYPRDRIAWTLADSNAAVIVTAGGEWDIPTLDLDADELADELAADADALPSVPLPPAAPAYVIYTSGTTGRPKGVEVAHQGVANLARWQAERFGVGPGSRVLQYFSFGFDGAVGETVMALLNGATLAMVPPDQRDPEGLQDWMHAVRPDVAVLIPSLLDRLDPTRLPEDFRPCIVSVGEACPVSLARAWATRCRFFNAYGPTEFTVYSHCHEVTGAAGSDTVPIGTPIHNARTYILDANLDPVPPGAVGDLYLAGDGLALGYLNRPDLTADKFLPNPFGRVEEVRDLGEHLGDAESFDDRLRALRAGIPPRREEAVQAAGEDTLDAAIGSLDADLARKTRDLLDGFDRYARDGFLRYFGEGLSAGFHSAGIDARLLERLLGDVTARRGADFCFGGGEVLDLLAELGADARGIDFSPFFVQRARARGRHAVMARVDSAFADFSRETEITAESLDFALSTLALDRLEDPGRMLANLFAALKPGGRFAIQTLLPISPVDDGEVVEPIVYTPPHKRITSGGNGDREELTALLFSLGAGEIGVLRFPYVVASRDGVQEYTVWSFVGSKDAGGSRMYRTGDRGRFLPDGSVEFLGRADAQLKLRGQRIEPAEIEAVLRRHPDVRDALVLPDRADRPTTLVAYFTASRTIPPESLRSYLKARLPEYLIPTVLIGLEAFPLTTTAKIDRAALPAPGRAPSASAPPDGITAELARLWEEALDRSPVGPRDDFLDLGGHSLAAMSIAARIEKRYGKKIPLGDFFEGMTVERAARLVAGGGSETRCLVNLQPKGSRPPFFCVHPAGGHVVAFSDLARGLGGDQPFIGIQAVGIEGDEPPPSTIEAMAERYVTEIVAAHPNGPYRLGGWSTGAVVALEIANRLRARGREVDVLALLDPTPFPFAAAPPDERMLLARFAAELALPVGAMPDLSLPPTEDGLSGLARDIAAHPASPIADARTILRLFTMFKHNVGALRTHEPTRFDGDALLFASDEFRAAAGEDPTRGWRALVGGRLETIAVPGPHAAVTRLPNAAHVIVRLSDALGRPGKDAS